MKSLSENAVFGTKICKSRFAAVICGGAAGFINGVFGGGGGMIIVPVLSGILNLSQKQSNATAMMIILPISVVSGFFYSFFGNVDINLLVSSGIGVLSGGVVGAVAFKKFSQRSASIIFYTIMALTGVKMAFF